jgi:hypothetical protein
MKNLACQSGGAIATENGMKPITSVTLVGSVAALALTLTQISVMAVLAGAAIGGIAYALMPRDTIQR